MSISWWIYKHIVSYKFSRILFYLKKNFTSDTVKINESQKYYVEWKTLDTKVYILYGLIYIKLKKIKQHSDRSVIAKVWGWEEWTNWQQEGNYFGKRNTLYFDCGGQFRFEYICNVRQIISLNEWILLHVNFTSIKQIFVNCLCNFF